MEGLPMRQILLTLLLIGSLFTLGGCFAKTEEPPAAPPAGQPPTESPQSSAPTEPAQPPTTPQPNQPRTEQPPQTYQNDIFQNVTVKKVKADTYEVKGQAMIFEAVVDYVVEDGHNELTKGHVMASKGAPEWGDFSFTLHVKKAEPNSTLMLILYETSAKDGSRRLELPIPLPE
jgi:hypothetical protein